jgi:hypothetical protein
MTSKAHASRLLIFLLLCDVLLSAPALAETVKCQRAIIKASAQYSAKLAAILGECSEAVIRGEQPGCPGPEDDEAITKAKDALERTIDRSCGGADGVCQGDPDDDAPATLGWPSECPNILYSSCNNSISHCGDVADCVECLVTAGASNSLEVPLDFFALPSTSNATLNECQQTIVAELSRFVAKKTKAMRKCWDTRLSGKHMNFCPDGKAATVIAKAEAKKVAAICKACGGSDALCDGTGDITPATIGAPPSCPDLEFSPATLDCQGPIDDLEDLVRCYDCMAEVEVDCVDRAGVPQFAPYPHECLLPENCEDSSPFTCGGSCGAGLKCAAVPGQPPYYEPVCGCIPDDNQPCDVSHTYYCNGSCSGGGQCGSLGITYFSDCFCGNPACGEAEFPTCAGDCPSGQDCVATVFSSITFCGCVATGSVCSSGPCNVGACPNAGEACDMNSCSCVLP